MFSFWIKLFVRSSEIASRNVSRSSIIVAWFWKPFSTLRSSNKVAHVAVTEIPVKLSGDWFQIKVTQRIMSCFSSKFILVTKNDMTNLIHLIPGVQHLLANLISQMRPPYLSYCGKPQSLQKMFSWISYYTTTTTKILLKSKEVH